MNRLLHTLLSSVAFVACGWGQQTQAEPASTEPAATPSHEEPRVAAPRQARRCLPLLNGCGCADRCADGFQQADGSWGVVRPMGRSALDAVTLERRCFDPRGVSYAEGGEPAEADDCIDVFAEPMACGGECIPRTEFLLCGVGDDGSCGPTSALVEELVQRLGRSTWDAMSADQRECHLRHPRARIGDGQCESLQ